ncbi:MAG: hypothetical protein WD066_09820, partial [Planctomycetaceae bacterium]
MLRFHSLTAAASLLIAAASIAFAQREGVYTDPENPGIEYALQGEFAGEIDGKKYGAQVIALGDWKYDIVLYEGGLPGEGWTRKDSKHRVSGKGGRIEGVSSLGGQFDRLTVMVSDTLMLLLDERGNTSGRLERARRKSPTLDAKPPEGAIILFDGESAEHFKNGKLTDDGLLMADCES